MLITIVFELVVIPIHNESMHLFLNWLVNLIKIKVPRSDKLVGL